MRFARICGIIKNMALGKSDKDDKLKLNQIGTSLLIFMESYNKSIPASFPHATVKILKQFQTLHPVLFRNNSDEWSIERHRKRLMDWLPSYESVT